MGLGFEIGKALGKLVKGAFVASKKSTDIPAPPVWQLKQRAIHNAVQNMHDPRLEGWYPKSEPMPNKDLVRESIQELPHDKEVCAEHLQMLISGAMNKSQMQIIRQYLKSAAANNLDAYTKAELWMACAQRMHYLTALFDFMS